MGAIQTVGGRYQLLEQIGEGGVGKVYRAYDEVLNREVAVKMLSESWLGPDARSRLIREARTAAGLNHPHIVSIFDAGEEQPSPYIVMELVEGISLRELTQTTLSESLVMIRQIVEALVHAHASGIVHRDLKPENIMVTGDRVIKLMDFGLALQAGVSRITDEHTLAGTLSYLAPELVMGEDATPQSDLYALGVTMYEMTAGRPPFTGDNLVAVISQHMNAPVVPPRTYNPAISSELEAIILTLLKKSPDERYDSTQALLDDLGALEEIGGSVPALHRSETSTGEISSGVALLDRIVRGRVIGREDELAELRAFWHRAEDGEGHMALISGEPGIGKTRIVEELAVYARLRNAVVLQGGYDPGLTTTYRAFREMLRDRLKTMSDHEAARHLEATAQELVKLLPEITDIVGNVTPNSPLGDLEAEQVRLFDHITRFLLAQADDRPLLLILEDLHWADQPSLHYLHYLLRNITDRQVLVVGTYREVELKPERPFYEALLGMNRERLYTRLMLKRLSPENIGAMLAALLDAGIEQTLVDIIALETEGNPFFIEEVLKSLLEKNSIRLKDGIWKGVEGIQLEVPQSIQIAIDRRLKSLDEATRDMLVQAAVLGREFEVDVLLAMGDWDEDPVLDGLDDAGRAQIIREIQGSKGDRYRFAHALLVQVLYESINTRRRARFHHKAGEAIETLYADNLDSQLVSLLYHFSQARTNAAEKVVHYGMRAAEKAAAVYANDQAIKYYETCLEALQDTDDLETTARVYELLGDTQYLIYHIDDSQESYDQALAAFEAAGITDNDRLWRLYFKRGRDFQYTATREYLERALHLMPETGEEEERAKVEAALALAILGDRDVDSAYDQAQAALQTAQTASTRGGEAAAYSALCYVHQARGDLAAYIETSMKQARALEGTDDMWGQFSAYWHASASAHLIGDYEEAERLCLASQALADEKNAPGWEALSLAVYTNLLATTGRWSEAMNQADRVLPLFKQIGGDSCFSYIFQGVAEIEAKRGVPDQSRQFMRSAIDILDSLQAQLSSLALQFAEHSYLEEWEEAWQRLEEIKAIHGSMLPNSMIGSSQFWAAILPLAAARSGHFDEAVEFAENLIERAQSPKLLPLIATSTFALGVTHAMQEEWNEALDTFEQALTIFRDIGRPWDVANTLFEMGMVYRSQDRADAAEQARRNFEEALSIFNELEARPAIEKVSGAMSAL